MVIKRNQTKNSRTKGKTQRTKSSVGNKRAEQGSKPLLYNIGLDISTSVVGICVFDNEGRLEILDGIKLGTPGKYTFWEKADLTLERIDEELKGRKIDIRSVGSVFVESAVKRFSPGGSNADTIFTLARFNAVISYLCYKKFNKPVIEVNVSSARKAIGFTQNKMDKRPIKEQVFDYNTTKYPNYPWKTHLATRGKSKGKTVFDTEMLDASDALVIVQGGLKIKEQQDSGESQPKKKKEQKNGNSPKTNNKGRKT